MKVTGRIPIQIPANKYDALYLETKRKSGQLLDKPSDLVIGEQLDCIHRTSNSQVRFGIEETEPLVWRDGNGAAAMADGR